MNKYKPDYILAKELTRQQSDLLIQWVFNVWHLDSYKLTSEKFTDTEYRYDIYLKDNKRITTAQQMFINGFIACLKITR
jgi:hypothetical protein